MLQHLLFLCAFAVPGIRALVVPVVEATAEDPKCLDITHCRTLSNIVWSCLITIFACTWVSIHHNVVLGLENGIDYAALWERVWVTALTLLVPEYTLAWAVRQWIMAREIAKELNTATSDMQKKEKKGEEREVGEKKEESEVEVDEEKENSKVVGLWTRFTRTTAGLCKTLGGRVATLTLYKVLHKRYSKTSPWTTAHGFFVLMGGFYHFNGDKPHHPASREEVADMISKKSFAPPNILAIKGRGKRDAFSKTVTILQTLWFVMQCIARGIQHLPITNLEIATLTYTTISIAMYRFWLNKPVNVSHPIQLTRTENAKELQPKGFLWPNLIGVIAAMGGVLDNRVHLSKLRQVPTLYSGRPTWTQIFRADIIALAVGAIFGAVHCIAWSFAFPSQAEKLLWRISAVITVAVPLFCVVTYVYIAYSGDMDNLLDRILMGAIQILICVGVLLYLVARAILLVLTFTTLRDLPPAAYKSIHWMSFIPHV